jgi:hypothetical protein
LTKSRENVPSVVPVDTIFAHVPSSVNRVLTKLQGRSALRDCQTQWLLKWQESWIVQVYTAKQKNIYSKKLIGRQKYVKNTEKYRKIQKNIKKKSKLS